MGQFNQMAEEVGFQTRRRGDVGARKSAPTGSPRRADDASHGPATREALTVARYITDMTAQLEAMAIEARLDQLAYFLGMANLESEMFFRTNDVGEAERAEEESNEPAVGLLQENKSFD
jgi:hypothetical protein